MIRLRSTGVGVLGGWRRLGEHRPRPERGSGRTRHKLLTSRPQPPPPPGEQGCRGGPKHPANQRGLTLGAVITVGSANSQLQGPPGRQLGKATLSGPSIIQETDAKVQRPKELAQSHQQDRESSNRCAGFPALSTLCTGVSPWKAPEGRQRAYCT